MMLRHVILCLSLAASSAWAELREGLVLIVNRNVPESMELARHYCMLRDLPEDRICALDLPEGESISRGDFDKRLRDPLLAWLRANRWVEQVRRNPRRVRDHESEWTTVSSRLRVLCSFYGVPVRIEDTRPWVVEKIQNRLNHSPQRDEAAVDSELTLLLHGAYDIRGRFANPYYGQLRWETSGSQNLFLVLATRLDGPDPDAVRRMMDGALEAETYGLLGRMFFDLRAPHQDEYQVGDYWLGEAVSRFDREGYDCIVERSDSLYGTQFPMDSAALYWGWYTEQVTGPFTRTGFAFRPGALAYHNHSANAKVLRTRAEYWTGPLLGAGAAASWGAVGEPFLGTTPHLHILADRLCRGLSFAESTYLALPALSWQITVVGDPLYRPFALSLDEQISKLEEAGRPEVEWAWLRRMNLLVRDGRLHGALAYGRDRLRVRDSGVVREKMGELLALNDLAEDALPHFDRAVELAAGPDTAVRVGLRYLRLLRAMGRAEKAQEVEARLRERWNDSPYLALLQPAQPPSAP
ncbi:MAG TPA: TIGR03790 family protein [Kiritimatiellia bacterium]|nr:TIGR03790 family protein [Kiritimatiellia bacterium]